MLLSEWRAAGVASGGHDAQGRCGRSSRSSSGSGAGRRSRMLGDLGGRADPLVADGPDPGRAGLRPRPGQRPAGGPRASGKLVRWNRVQIGDYSIEMHAGHRLLELPDREPGPPRRRRRVRPAGRVHPPPPGHDGRPRRSVPGPRVSQAGRSVRARSSSTSTASSSTPRSGGTRSGSTSPGVTAGPGPRPTGRRSWAPTRSAGRR